MRIFLGNFLTGALIAACLLTAISDYRMDAEINIPGPLEWGEQQIAHWQNLPGITRNWIAFDAILLLGGTIFTWWM